MSFFSTTVDVKPGADRAAAEKAMADTIAEFLAKGPTVAELARSKTSIEAGVIRGLEKVGGFRGKAAILAEGALYADDPGFILKQLEWLRAATPADVLAAARDVMSAGHYQIDVLPFPEFTTTASSVNRKTGLPAVASTPDLEFPDIAEARLANGMKVVMARRAAIPVVNVALQFDAGYSSDSVSGARLGAASFASAMLDEGTKRRTAQQIAEQAASLGAQIAVGSSLDSTSASLSALKSRLAPSLDLLADIVRNPSFDQSEIDKLRGLWLARIEQEKADPVRLALRVLPPELYGSGHAYGVPFTGSGTVDEIKALTRADLVRFHETWIRPDNATIFVVGDTTLAEIKPLLEHAFGDWRAPARPKAAKNVASVSRPARGKAIIIDKPGSPQSLILAGVVAPPTGAPNNVAITAMNDVLGGQFTARINMNLRETKGWAYGAYTFLQDARGQRPYLVYAPVQTDKTRESIAEILREMKAFKTTAPASAEELTRAVNINTRSLPGSFETAGAVLGSLAESERFGRPWDYPAGLKEAYEALTRADIAAAAAEAVHPESLIWVIVGDRAKIEAGVRALNLGDVEVRSISDL
jgi:zinc protease